MKKILLIAGIVVILLIAGIWVYLLLNGGPGGVSGIQNPFSFPGSSDATEEERRGATEPQEELAATSGQRRDYGDLMEITNRQVAGAAFVEIDGQASVRYAERGTGHVYEYSLTNESERRITNTTVARTTNAVWSPRGNRVVLEVEDENGGSTRHLYSIEKSDTGEGSLIEGTLPSNAVDIQFDESGDSLRYRLFNGSESVGYQVDLKTDATTELFRVPLRDIVTLWQDDGVFIYTKPSALIDGFVYKVKVGNALERVDDPAAGLMAEVKGTQMLLSKSALNNMLSSRILDIESGDTQTISPPLFTEKCEFDRIKRQVLWCAASTTAFPGLYPDFWYQGLARFSDSLWMIDIDTDTAIPVPGIEQASVDVIDLQTDPSGSYLLFKNKNDDSLWLQSGLRALVEQSIFE